MDGILSFIGLINHSLHLIFHFAELVLQMGLFLGEFPVELLDGFQLLLHRLIRVLELLFPASRFIDLLKDNTVFFLEVFNVTI